MYNPFRNEWFIIGLPTLDHTFKIFRYFPDFPGQSRHENELNSSLLDLLDGPPWREIDPIVDSSREGIQHRCEVSSLPTAVPLTIDDHSILRLSFAT